MIEVTKICNKWSNSNIYTIKLKQSGVVQYYLPYACSGVVEFNVFECSSKNVIMKILMLKPHLDDEIWRKFHCKALFLWQPLHNIYIYIYIYIYIHVFVKSPPNNTYYTV
jgi:hypothetical protein